MNKYLLLGCVWLVSCGGNTERGDAEQIVPKPVFTVKFIDSSITENLAVKKIMDNKAQNIQAITHYAIDGLDEKQNFLEHIGKHPEDLEAIEGKCFETNQGAKNGWQEKGICAELFGKLLGNIAQNSEELKHYLLVHAGLRPYQQGKTGYAAVQNGRYILEISSEGKFSFRRRHY